MGAGRSAELRHKIRRLSKLQLGIQYSSRVVFAVNAAMAVTHRKKLGLTAFSATDTRFIGKALVRIDVEKSAYHHLSQNDARHYSVRSERLLPSSGLSATQAEDLGKFRQRIRIYNPIFRLNAG